MPMPPEHYPPGWSQFSDSIRFTRARGRCECTGECGLHGHKPNIRRCTEMHHQKARFAQGIVRLTVAHLCQCDPICKNPTHVKAMCQRCHLRVDRFKHARTRAGKRRSAPATSPSQNTRQSPCSPEQPLPPARPAYQLFTVPICTLPASGGTK